jgi:hypothetical protein
MGRVARPRSSRNNEVISEACKGTFDDRPPVETASYWRVIAGPPLTSCGMRFAVAGLIAPPPAFSTARAKAEAIADRDRQHPVPSPMIGPHDVPVDIVGGYRFPNAPRIDLHPPASSIPLMAASIDSDLSIPDFLDRRNSARTSAASALSNDAEKADAPAYGKGARYMRQAKSGVEDGQVLSRTSN